MVCRLCLENNSQVLEIFNINGQELNIAIVIGKHLWFEPKKDDPISTIICDFCWKKLSDFHDFYEYVEKAQQLLNVEIIVKTEDNIKFHNTAVEEVVLSNKQEPNDKIIDELYEESVNVPTDILEENNINLIEFEIPPDLKYQSLELEKDEEYIDDENKYEMQDFKDVDCDSEFKIEDENLSLLEVSEEQTYKKTRRKKTTKSRKSSRKEKNSTKTKEVGIHPEENGNKPRKINRKEKKSTKTKEVDIHPEENGNENATASSYKGRGRPRKGEVAPLKTKVKCSKKENPIKPRIYKDETGSDITAQENSEIINRSISEYMQLKCDICGLEFATFGLVRNHMMTVHETHPYVKCCEKKFSKRTLLYDHIKFHLNPDIYRCEKCDKLFSDKRSLTNHHIVKHQSEETKIFQCPQCPKKFAKKYLLQTHISRHSDELKYFCQECGKGYSYMSALTSHTTLKHGNYGTMCDICSKFLKGPSAFKKHQLEHQGIVEAKVQCDLCGSWHKDKLSLAKHKRRHTYREQPQVCNVCQKTYACREALYRHKRFVHESDGKYECNICKKSFKMANSLKEHMSQHTGLSLYRCPHCSRTFNNNSNMHKHRKHMHPKEFDEFRRLRKISARSKEPILPSISFLSDATKEPCEIPQLPISLQELIEDKHEYGQYELDTLQ